MRDRTPKKWRPLRDPRRRVMRFLRSQKVSSGVQPCLISKPVLAVPMLVHIVPTRCMRGISYVSIDASATISLVRRPLPRPSPTRFVVRPGRTNDCPTQRIAPYKGILFRTPIRIPINVQPSRRTSIRATSRAVPATTTTTNSTLSVSCLRKSIMILHAPFATQIQE